MTEIQVTDELIEAAKEVSVDLARGGEVTSTPSKYIAVILAALPEEVTNPKPEMPSEPGHYEDGRGYAVTLRETGDWLSGSYGYTPEAMAKYGPFTRLVPEKPPVTAEEVWEILDGQNVDSSVLSELADYINNRA